MNPFLLAVGGYDTNIRLFDSVNNEPVRMLQFCDQQVLRLAFSGSAPVPTDAPLFLAVAGSPSVAVYDVSTNHTSPNMFAIFQGHLEAVTAVGFEPNHNAFVYSASEDGTLQTWLPKLAAPPQSPYPSFHSHSVPHPMLSAASATFALPAKLVNNKPDGTTVAIHDAAYYPPRDVFFTVDFLGRFRVWNHRTSSLMSEHIPHPSCRNLQCIDLSHDYSNVVMANFDGFVFIYDTRSVLASDINRPNTLSKPLTPLTIRASNSYIPRVKLSYSGALLVCTRSGAIKIFKMSDILNDRVSKKPASINQVEEHSVMPVREFTGRPGWIWDASFIEDSEKLLFTCSSVTQVMLWHIDNLGCSVELTGFPKPTVCLAVRERRLPSPHQHSSTSAALNRLQRTSLNGRNTTCQDGLFNHGSVT
ncbi:WD40/YVTN repeat-like containing protein [Gracilaria domingensis]|nr:WD40/YVTN repeat-like containing protein [Gracilaria domingensis]